MCNCDEKIVIAASIVESHTEPTEGLLSGFHCVSCREILLGLGLGFSL